MTGEESPIDQVCGLDGMSVMTRVRAVSVSASIAVATVIALMVVCWDAPNFLSDVCLDAVMTKILQVISNPLHTLMADGNP